MRFLLSILLLCTPYLVAEDLLHKDLGDFVRASLSPDQPGLDGDGYYQGFGLGWSNTQDGDSMFHVSAEFGAGAGFTWLKSFSRWTIAYADDLNLHEDDAATSRKPQAFSTTIDLGLMPRMELEIVGLYAITGATVTWANRLYSDGHAWGFGIFLGLGLDIGTPTIRGFIEYGARWNAIFAGDDVALSRAVELQPFDFKFGVRLFY